MHFIIGTLLLLLLSFSCSNRHKTEQPNILFIMSDDHAWQALSAYGHDISKIAPTPEIDRIAESGIRFDRCLVTNSICGPSRATILTGKYSHLNGFTGNGDSFNGNQQTFPKLLQAAGYQTTLIGKWHLATAPTGFDTYDILPGQGKYYNPEFIKEEGKYTVEGYVTEVITEKSIEWMDKARLSEKPFMLMMQHKAPHAPWTPGPNELGLFSEIDFPEPPNLLENYSLRGIAMQEQKMTIRDQMTTDRFLKMLPQRYPDYSGEPSRYGWITDFNFEQAAAWNAVYDPIINEFYSNMPEGDDLVRFKYQQYMMDYLGCVAAVDKSIGKVLDYLESTGLDKNTLVVYTSDQGFFLGEHGWFDKRFMFEESLRTPLLMMWQGHTVAGSVCKELVSNVDFAATFLDAAGVEIPLDIQGRSLVPILKGNIPDDWRTAHYYHYFMYPGTHNVKRHYGITTNRYKLIHYYYDIDEWELYDLQADPMEMKNVYAEDGYKDVREDLHRQLEELRVHYKDTDEVTRSLLPENN